MQLIDTPFFLNEEHKHANEVLQLGKVNVINMQLQLGQIMADQEAETDILIIVKTGKVVFTVEGERGEVSPQNILHITKGEKYDLKAIAVSDFIVLQIQ